MELGLSKIGRVPIEEKVFLDSSEFQYLLIKIISLFENLEVPSDVHMNSVTENRKYQHAQNATQKAPDDSPSYFEGSSLHVPGMAEKSSCSKVIIPDPNGRKKPAGVSRAACDPEGGKAQGAGRRLTCGRKEYLEGPLLWLTSLGRGELWHPPGLASAPLRHGAVKPWATRVPS